jgi:hypothetical protein
MIQKISLLLLLLFSLSVKVDSLIIKNNLPTIKQDKNQFVTTKQVIRHLADLEDNEVMFVEFCQFGCFHHTVSRMSITKESEHYNLILYNTPISEPGGIWTSSYHDSTTYHNSFTLSKMQLADFQKALLPDNKSESTNHNVITILFQGQEYLSADRAYISRLKNFLEILEAEQCTCEDSKYYRTEEYKGYLSRDLLEFRSKDQSTSPFIVEQFE